MVTDKHAFWRTHLDVCHLDECAIIYKKTWQLNAVCNHLDHQRVPMVTVCASLTPQNALYLSYFIQKTPDLPLDDTPNTQKTCRADYLWQENCLECFLKYHHQRGYLESNLALDGRYNVYHFEDYRTPNVMPPRWAKLDDGQFCVLNNQSNSSNSQALDGCYHRHVRLQNPPNHRLSRIHPCVILYCYQQPIFYAVHHANPPDFHDARHWQMLE